MNAETIGRGTWIDKLAFELVEREKSLGRSLDMIKVESGLGASGVPHIGSLGDAVRAYGVKLALEDAGYVSELVAYSDDLDGLRKVPAGFDASLEEHIGKPVSAIPDPSGCHDSYGAHMSSMLLDSLDALGISYTHMRAKDAYASGLFAEQTRTILESAQRIGEHISNVTGQTKFHNALPYYPVCSKCGRLYTAVAGEYLGEGRVAYSCIGSEIGGKRVEGCGNEGESDALHGEGKLAWKVEFAARWAALDVRFEAYGKDIMDSVAVNDWVCENVLGRPSPHHVRYEMFLDTAGTKISKSSGNVLTPQTWLEYGTPESLLLLLYKRITGARRVGVKDIPELVDELATLEAHYFGTTKEPNKEKATKLKGLYEYVHLLAPPAGPVERPPYPLLVELAGAFKEDRESLITRRLIEYGTIKEAGPTVSEYIRLAGNYADAHVSGVAHIELDPPMREALREIADALDAGTSTQDAVGSVAQKNSIQRRDIFRTLYLVLIGAPSGPRLSTFVDDVGAQRVAEKIRGHL